MRPPVGRGCAKNVSFAPSVFFAGTASMVGLAVAAIACYLLLEILIAFAAPIFSSLPKTL
jgi:hypothetical protein